MTKSKINVGSLDIVSVATNLDLVGAVGDYSEILLVVIKRGRNISRVLLSFGKILEESEGKVWQNVFKFVRI